MAAGNLRKNLDTTEEDDDDESPDNTEHDAFRYMPLEDTEPNTTDQPVMECQVQDLDNRNKSVGSNGNHNVDYQSDACENSDIEVIEKTVDSVEGLHSCLNDNNPFPLTLNEIDNCEQHTGSGSITETKLFENDIAGADLSQFEKCSTSEQNQMDMSQGDTASNLDSLSSDTPTLRSSSSNSGSNSNMMVDELGTQQEGAQAQCHTTQDRAAPNLDAEAREIFAAIDALDRERCDSSDSRSPASSSVSHSPYDSPIHRPGIPLEPSIITYDNGVLGRPDSLVLPRPLQYYEKRRLIKKDSSASSLSEFSSRSSSMDALIEAATSTPLHSQGVVTTEGDMVAFVATGLEQMIRMSSPHSRRDSSGASYSGNLTPKSVTSLSSSASGWSTSSASGWSYSGLSRGTATYVPLSGISPLVLGSPSVLTQSPDDIPPVDPRALMDLEVHARKVAASLDSMMTGLKNNLFKMSSITFKCLDAYKLGIDETCDSVDSAIKSMYALMAKCEEVSTRIRPLYQLQKEIQEINRLLDLFESQMSKDERRT